MANSRSLKAGDAFIQFSLRDGAVKKQLKNLQRRFTAIGAGLQRLAGIGLKVGVGVAAGLALPVKAASDLQETMGKFVTVFGDNSKTIKAWGDNFAGQVGRSRGEVAGFLAGMQDLFVPLGFASDEAEGLSKQVTALAVDLASFNNKSDADAIRDLQAALTGSGEVMKKYGVIVSEAAVKQQLLNQGLDPTNVSEQEKVQARLNIIMAGTTAAQGDAVRTSASFANQMKRAKGAMVDFAAAIGQPLLAPLAKLLEWFSGLAVQGSANAGKVWFSVRDFIGKAAAFMAERYAAIWEISKTVWGGISALVTNMLNGTGGVISKAMAWWQGAFDSTLGAIAFAFKNWRTLIETAAVSASLSVVRFANQTVHLFGTVIPKWLFWLADNWREIFTDWVNINKAVYSNIWENSKNFWNALMGLFNGDGFNFTWTPLLEGFESTLKEMPRIAAREMGPIESELQGRMNELGEELVKGWEDNRREIMGNAKSFADFAADSLAASGAIEGTKAVAKAAAQAGKAAAREVAAKSGSISSSSRGIFSVSALQSLQGGRGDQLSELKEQTKHLKSMDRRIANNKIVAGA